MTVMMMVAMMGRSLCVCLSVFLCLCLCLCLWSFLVEVGLSLWSRRLSSQCVPVYVFCFVRLCFGISRSLFVFVKVVCRYDWLSLSVSMFVSKCPWSARLSLSRSDWFSVQGQGLGLRVQGRQTQRDREKEGETHQIL